jgi:lysyl-tRNA synthetase class 1
MALSTPGLVRSVLTDFERSDAFLEVAITDALRKAGDGYAFQNQEERHAWWAESAAFSFSLRADGKESPWNTSYGPLFTATKEDGSPFYSPDISQANVETIRYWEVRSGEAKHPILIARYADLVWDFDKLVAGKKPPIQAAERAIDSYMDAARLQYKIAIQPIRYMSRALDLALSVGDKQRISTVVDATFELYEKVATPGRPGSWIFLFDTLYGNKKLGLSTDQETTIVQKLEQMLARSADRSTPQGFDPWGAEAAAQRLGQHYQRLNQPDEVKRVIGTFCRAFEQIAEGASPLLAMGWLHRCMKPISMLA